MWKRAKDKKKYLFYQNVQLVLAEAKHEWFCGILGMMYSTKIFLIVIRFVWIVLL